MSIIGSNILAGAAGSGVSAYEIEQSLRFNSADSAYLSRTPSSAGNLRTGTISFWIKRSKLQSQPVQNTQMSLLGCIGNGPFFLRYRYQQDYLEYNQGWAGGTGAFDTLAHYRDVCAWQHVCLVNDFTNATAADKVRLYMNGVRQDLTITSALTNADGSWNSTNLHYIGYLNAYFDGYMAEFHNVDGTALDPTSFGEYDNNGVWRPIAYTGSYGTNGFYLTFDPSATNGIGHDHSGNGNNFTPSGFTTSGTGTDVMSDTPTTNWCTLNPLLNQGGSFSEGNLVFTGVGTSYQGSRGTIAIPSSGKWYWESTATTHTTTVGNWTGVGMATAAVSLSSFAGQVAGSVFYGDRNDSNSLISNGTSVVDQGTTTNFSQGDILQCAYDADTGKFWFGLNNSWWDSSVGTTGNPSAGTNQTLTAAAGEYFPIVQTNRTHVITTNFGQRDFAYTPPTGFNALNTANLPAPDIKDGGKYFDTLTWSGTGGSSGATRSLTGLGFSPDLVWGKVRSSSGVGHILMDSVRGVGTGKYLQSNTANAEGTSGPNESLYGYLSSLDSTGFTVTNGTSTFDNWNKSADTYVAWNWLAGGSGSSNTDGSITSTVSANPSAGFSVVAYTGTGANATVGHGLGVAPAMMIIKDRDAQTRWIVYHQTQGNAGYLRLDDTAAFNSDSTVFNTTSPSSTVFSVGTSINTNPTGNDVIAYCFAEVEGYSKFGSYTANNTTDNSFVFCGFKPAFLLIKNYTSGGNDSYHWCTYDDTRSEYNATTNVLWPSNAGSENSSSYSPKNGPAGNGDIDFLSNGFKIRSSASAMGGSDSYVFAAFASHPFGGSGVSPVTAR